MDQKQPKEHLHTSHKLYQKTFNDDSAFGKESDYKQMFDVKKLSGVSGGISGGASGGGSGSTSSTISANSLNPANKQIMINLNNPIHHNSGRITLVVENTRFIVNTELFVGHSDTMLGRMFGASNCTSNLIRPNEKGEYNVAEGISANVFKAVLVSVLFKPLRSLPDRVGPSECALYLILCDAVIRSAVILGSFLVSVLI